jgi:hypothetical protein
MLSVLQETEKLKKMTTKKEGASRIVTKREVYLTFRDEYINSFHVESFADWLLRVHKIDYMSL